MISQDLQALVPKFLRMTRIIWMAFLVAPLLYAVIAWFVADARPVDFESGWPDGAVYILVLLAVVSGPVFSWVIAPRIAGPKKMVGPGTTDRLVTDFGENQARYERLGEREKVKAQYLGAIQSSFIVRWAGAESVAIYGLMGLFTGAASMFETWGFCLAAIVLVGMLRPDYGVALETLDV